MDHMRLTVIRRDFEQNEPIVFLNREDSLRLGVDVTDRVRITGDRQMMSKIMIADSMVSEGYVAIPENLLERCGSADGDAVDVSFLPVPESVRCIRKKIEGYELSYDELNSIICDINEGNLSELEIVSFVSAFNINNASMREIADLTRAMAATGETVDMSIDDLYDFHSLGGVPGNKITPIVVSIIASEGIHIPKMSSRAVSSACGTSDFVDTFCDVEIDPERLIRITRESGGVFACGNERYAPVGRKIINAERPMGIDPRPMMMASIMSKKIAIGINHLLIDIPMGNGSKIPDMDTAEGFARSFIELGSALGIDVQCAVSRAEQPIGRAIGPVLEAKECISTLETGGGHISVVDKACGMAGVLLEMAGKSDGKKMASECLRNGRAHRKFMEIVKAQNGSSDLSSDDLIPGCFSKDIHAKRSGYVQYIDNAGLVAVAKGAGAPSEIGAGLILKHKKGDKVSEGDVLFTIYAENRAKLERSVESARSRMPLYVSNEYVDQITEDMIVRSISRQSK